MVQQGIPHHYHRGGIFRLHIFGSCIVRACVVCPRFFGSGVILCILGNPAGTKARSLGSFRNRKDHSDHNGQFETAYRPWYQL